MNVAPGASFETVADGFATGLVGTIGVRVIDNVGATTIARVTAGVIEYPAGSAIYAKTLTAPTAAGQFTLVWDDGSGNYATEDLLVTYSLATAVGATGRDLCSLTDVTTLVPGYTAGDDANTDATLQELIHEQSRDAMERCGREFTPVESVQPAVRLFDIDDTVVRRRRLLIGDMAAAPTLVRILDGQGNAVQTVVASSYVMLPRVREDWQPYGLVWFRADATAAAPLWGSEFGRWGWTGGWVVEITATWGFPFVPETVKTAVARLVIVRYLNDVTNQGTQFADAADRVQFNQAASIRQALDALDRFYVPAF